MSEQRQVGSEESFQRGLATRREVLGAEYVDAAIASASGFDEDFQRLVTTYCWDEVWNRDVLPRKVRSLLNIAMMTALRQQHELSLHVRGARANGASVAEIEEVILQAAVYCGLPAALQALRTTREALAES